MRACRCLTQRPAHGTARIRADRRLETNTSLKGSQYYEVSEGSGERGPALGKQAEEEKGGKGDRNGLRKRSIDVNQMS